MHMGLTTYQCKKKHNISSLAGQSAEVLGDYTRVCISLKVRPTLQRGEGVATTW